MSKAFICKEDKNSTFHTYIKPISIGIIIGMFLLIAGLIIILPLCHIIQTLNIPMPLILSAVFAIAGIIIIITRSTDDDIFYEILMFGISIVFVLTFIATYIPENIIDLIYDIIVICTAAWMIILMIGMTLLCSYKLGNWLLNKYCNRTDDEQSFDHNTEQDECDDC